jgi:MraZ protein
MGRPRFVGNYVHSVDAKGRFAVPVQYRGPLAPEQKTFFLVPGRDRSVAVHLAEEWDDYERRYLENMPEHAPETQRAKRYLYSQMEEATCDVQGRLLLPKHLREVSGIGSEVVVAGHGSFFELWEPTRYREVMELARAQYDADRNAAGRQSWETTKGQAGTSVSRARDGV